ncbi:uncharacterized protein MJAP1_000109 [Malassezia japonica]|uniref:Uncharacterized protein n=1 Tax=Malassezia japonica TaxID=223818 RepID=A0AAF0J7Z6_9BASI|nr:uncharacterized protein MJAP1_000109 [Malassezia japonica]WFD37167.1 hypothetical protein MJAP1_000109 [Malassezia japonica]
MASGDFLRLIGVRKTDDPWVFVSVSLPGRAGNQQPIAYGGCATTVALNAAGQTIKQEPRMVPYSMVGHFLGPAALDTPFVCEVRPVRDTRTFATRHVTVNQDIKGKLRPVLALTLDMIASPNSTKEALEKAKARGADPGKVKSLLRYQIPPSFTPKSFKELEMPVESVKRRVASGELNEFQAGMFQEFLGLWLRMFEDRVVPESMMTQNLMGLHLKPTTQDDRAVSDRRAYDWFKLRQQLPPADGSTEMTAGGDDGMLPMTSVMAHLCALAFAMDGAIAFAPMSLNNESLLNASIASTLDFAQRYHTDNIDMNKFSMREIQTLAGGWQRHYTEARAYSDSGELLVTCTQQCVLRPAPGVVSEEDETRSKL